MDWLLPVRPAGEDGTTFDVGCPEASTDPDGASYGLVMACAVRAAAATVDGMVVSAVHATFLAPPEAGPVRVSVEITRSGRQVAVRRATIGRRRPGAVLTLSFAAPVPPTVQWVPVPGPVGEDPALLPHASAAAGSSPLDVRPVGSAPGARRGEHPYWARPAQPFGEDPAAVSAAIAIGSERLAMTTETMTTVPVAAQGPPDAGFPEALERSLWIHRRPGADEWLRYDASPPVVVGGRAVVRGTVTDRTGQLVASFAHEAMRGERP